MRQCMSALLKHTRGKVVKHKARFIMREQLHVISYVWHSILTHVSGCYTS